MSSSPAPASAGGRAPQQVEVYVAEVAGGRLVTVPGPDGPRLPGAVLAHGEHPRDAARRALAAAYPSADRGLPPGRDTLRVHEVRSDVRPRAGGPGLHVLRLVFEADRALPVPVPEPFLHDPVPAPALGAAPGEPPLVQRPAAYAVVVDDGHLLLSRLRHTGMWSLPGGGIDHGEHPEDAVRREIVEETGLALETARLADVDSHHFTGRSPSAVTENFHGVRLLYTGAVAGRGTPVVQEVAGTTDAAGWWPLEEVPGLRLNSVVRAALALVG